MPQRRAHSLSFSSYLRNFVYALIVFFISWIVYSFFRPPPPWHNPQLINQSTFVKGPIDTLVEIKNIPEKHLVLTTQVNRHNRAMPIRLVNGKKNSIICIQPGEIQRWRILNASTNDYFNFTIPEKTFYIISRDGYATIKPIAATKELLAPGDRIEILVRGPFWGNYPIQSLGFAKYQPDTFLTMKAQGAVVFGRKIPEKLLERKDLRKVDIDDIRKFVITKENPKAKNFTLHLDGEHIASASFNNSGTTEEWEVLNKTESWFPFSLSQKPFQVIAINGKPTDLFSYETIFTISPKGSVTIRLSYPE